jgi:hypothetical protein
MSTQSVSNPAIPASTSTQTNYVEMERPAIDWTADEVTRYIDMFGGEAGAKLAEHTVMLLGENPRWSSYRATDNTPMITEIRRGDSPMLNFLPMEGLSEEERAELRGKGLTNDQILKYFTNMKGSEGLGVDALLKGLSRGGFSLAAGSKGARLAFGAAPLLAPPPVGAFSKPLAGVGGFLAGSILGDEVGRAVAEYLFDLGVPEGVVLTPEAEADLAAAESSGTLVPYIAFPWLAPRSQLQMTRFIRETKPHLMIKGTEKSGFLVRNPETGKFRVEGINGPLPGLTAEDIATNPLLKKWIESKPLFRSPDRFPVTRTKNAEGETVVETTSMFGLLPGRPKGPMGQYLESGKVPLKERIVSGAEKALVSGGQKFREGTKVEKGMILAAESLAPVAAYPLVQSSLRDDPRNELKRAGAEIIASLAPQASILKHSVPASKAIWEYTTSRVGRARRGEKLDLFGAGSSGKLKIYGLIQDRFEQYGEDPNEFLKQLEDLMLTQDSSGKWIMKPEFKKIMDEDGSIFTSTYIDSLPVANLENSMISRVGDELGDARKKSFEKSITAQKATIRAFRNSGDLGLMQIAAKMQEEYYLNLIQYQMSTAIQKTTNAFERLYPEGNAPSAAVEKLGTNIKTIVEQQQDLFRNLQKQAWGQVPREKQMVKFFDDAGAEQKLPNAVVEWERALADMEKYNPTQYATFMNDKMVQNFNNTIMGWRARLGQATGGKSTLEVPEEVKAFQKKIEQMEGTDVLKRFNEAKRFKKITDETSDTNIQALNRTIEAFSGKGPKSEVVKLLELQRNALVAQRRAAGEATEAVLQGDNPLIYADFNDLRSTALALSRKYTDGLDNVLPSDYFASVFKGVQSAVLDDMNRANLGPAYDDARALSKAFQDYYKKTFGFDVVRQDSRGRDYIDTLAVTSDILTGSPDVRLLRVRQLTELGKQLAQRSPAYGMDAIAAAKSSEISMHTALLDTLRLAVRRADLTLDEKKGLNDLQIQERKLQKLKDWAVQNDGLVKMFPKLGEMINNVNSAEEFIDKATKFQTFLTEKVAKDKVLAEAINSANPGYAVVKAVNDQDPIKRLNGMLKRLRKPPMISGEKVLTRRGARTVGAKPAYDVKEAERALFASLMEGAFVDAGKQSNDLVEAEAGSRYLRLLTQEIPAIAQLDALQEILTNPEMLALALRTPRSVIEKDTIMMAQRFARSQPTVIQPRPPMRAPTPVAQAPMPAPAPQQGGANPQQRQQLAAMFPNDPILGAAGGIGSLFG